MKGARAPSVTKAVGRGDRPRQRQGWTAPSATFFFFFFSQTKHVLSVVSRSTDQSSGFGRPHLDLGGGAGLALVFSQIGKFLSNLSSSLSPNHRSLGRSHRERARSCLLPGCPQSGPNLKPFSDFFIPLGTEPRLWHGPRACTGPRPPSACLLEGRC